MKDQDSILLTVKKMLGLPSDYTPFDLDVIVHINSAFLTLNQLGIGPSTVFSITDKSNTWDEFTNDEPDMEAVKNYIFLKVRMLFDPPSSSIIMDALKTASDEMLFRLNVQKD